MPKKSVTQQKRGFVTGHEVIKSKSTTPPEQRLKGKKNLGGGKTKMKPAPPSALGPSRPRTVSGKTDNPVF